MLEICKKTKVINDADPELISNEITSNRTPIVLKGLVKNWDIVKLSKKSDKASMEYIRSFYNGKKVGAYIGPPEIKGRYHYNDDFSKLNFEKKQLLLTDVFDYISQYLYDKNQPSFYVGSASIDTCLPELNKNNKLKFSNHAINPLISIWLNNRSIIPCHYDVPINLVCCVAGKRRFTLFPPEQIDNLYPGSLEVTPGGQAVSMVDMNNPDLLKYPKIIEAFKEAEIAELEAGDALLIPSMWWHQVESLNNFNALINYWWDESPEYLPAPMSSLYLTLLSIKNRSVEEKKAWKSVFDYYVFNSTDETHGHIPSQTQGCLGELDELKVRQLRSMILNQLNR